jgi:PAS domain S-box-containing protein
MTEKVDPLRILLLEDTPADAELNEHALRKAGMVFESLCVDQRDAFIAALTDFRPDLILADYRLPGFDGTEALKIAQQQQPLAPFIFVTGTMGEDAAVESLRNGASDYLLKDRLSRLPEAVNHALAEARGKAKLEQTKQALESSEARFRAMVETTSDWIWEVDAQGRYTYASPAVQTLLGYTPEEVIGRTPFELMPPAEAAWIGHRFAELATTRQPINQLENVCLHRDGHRVILETSGVPVFAPDGEFAGYRGIDRDITSRHLIEAELHDANARAAMLADLMQRAAQPFSQSFPNGQLGIHNQAFLDLVGYSEADFASINLATDLTPPEWLAAETIKLDELHRTGHPVHYEKEYLRKDGSRVPIELLVHLIRDAAGQPKYYFAFITNITERRQTESRLAAQARLAQALLELPLAAETLDEAAFMQRGQELAEELTHSQIAFIHFVNDDQETIELVAWSRRTLENYCHAAFDKHYPVSQAGIWADALRQRTPVMINDYANATDKHGLPEGHAHLERLISVPVIEGGLVRMMTGVGNKPTPYTETDVEMVQLISNEVWRIVRQRRSENALRENEARLRSILRATPVGIGVVVDRVFIEVNETLLHMTGYRRDELLGQSSRLLYPSDAEFERVGRDKYAQIRAQGVGAIDTQWRRKEGEIRDIHLSSAPVDPGDYSKGVIFSAQDISERKQTENMLRKLAQAVEQSPESIVITDLDAKLEYVNETFVRNTGYSREEATGQNPRILHSGKTPKATYDALWAAMKDGRPWKGEFCNKRKDGSEYVEFAIITPLRQPDGSVSHYVAVKEDITEKKRNAIELDQHRLHLEELVQTRTSELLASQLETERLARVKSEFLANMSHEIRTPLNAVLGFAQIGLRDAEGLQSQTTFSRILDSGQLLLRVVNDILDFSKIEAGKLLIEQGVLHPGAILDRCGDLIRDSAQNKDLEFHIEEAADLPASCRGDELRLTQVLMNLLSNAVKFTAHGRVTLSAQRDATHLLFWVTDTGIGMSDAEQARLFQPFEQADSSTTRRFGGSGLGLAISKRLLELMGGQIEVSSSPGQGSEFRVSLPLQEPAGLAAPRAATPATPALGSAGQRLRGLSILVAEDNEVNRMVLAELLSKEGCRLSQVENGRLALEWVQAEGPNAFDLVLMDIQMPVMGGLEATRQIKAIAPDLPIIGLTAHALAEEREHCLAAGMADHVAKPIVLPVLINAIRKHLRGKADATELEALSAPPAVPPAATAPGNSVSIDWPAVAARYQDNMDFLGRLLNAIVQGNHDRPTALRQACDSGDFKQLAFLTHSLKGMAGDILPGSLRDLAGLTEVAARKELGSAVDHARLLARELDAFLDEVAAYLERAFVVAADAPSQPVDSDAIAALLDRLAALLTSSDAAANTLHAQSAALLRQAFGADAEKLGRQVQAFDFDAALVTIQRLRQHNSSKASA